MTSLRPVLLGTALLAASLIPAAVAVSSAATSPHRDRPDGVWLIAVERVQTERPPVVSPLLRPEVADGGTPWSITLTCGPRMGSHPDKHGACTDLDAADGHVGNLDPVTGGVCTDEYDPHLFTLTGMHHGEARSWSMEFTNYCEGVRITGGHVFAVRG